MQISVSRRQWLLSTLASAATTSSLWADEPVDHLANANRGDWLPPTSRSIRFDQQLGGAPVITAIAIDPRGELVAAAGDDHQIRILSTSTLTSVCTLTGHRDLVRTISFDASGSRLASAGNDGQLILWNRDQAFQILRRMEGPASLTCVRFSPEGNEIAAVGFGPEVHLMRQDVGINRGLSKRQPFRCQGGDLRAVAYRDDGQMLVAAGRSGELNLFDLSNDVQSRHRIHDGRIHGVAFHYNSQRVVCVADDGRVSVFDTGIKELVHRVPVTTGKLFAIAVLNSQLVAVAGSDNIIRIVNTDEGTITRRMEGHAGSVSTLAAGSGLLFSGSYDTTLRRWPIAEIESGRQRIAEGEPRVDR